MKRGNTLIKNLLGALCSVIVLLLLAVSLVFLFKDKIIGASIAEINKYLNAKVDINPAIELSLFEKFPQVALGFKDIKIYESIPGSENLLGKADQLYLTFDFWNIIDGNYVINKLYLENGEFDLKVNKQGINNYNLLKKDSTQHSNGKAGLDLTAIYIKNVLVKYSNEENEQYYEVLSHELKASFKLQDDVYLIKLVGPQFVKTIKIHESDYFKEKEIFITSDLEYNNLEKKFTILPTSVKVLQSEFKVVGTYLFKADNEVNIKIDNDKSDVQTLLSLIPKKYYQNFSSYKSEGEIYFHATIKGKINDNENAAINVDFGCKEASFYHPDLKKKILNATMYGSFTNGNKKNAQTSSLKFENIRFDFDEKMVQGNFMYQNFTDPLIAFDATGNLNAASILDFYKIPSIKSASGNIDFDIDFKGKFDDFKTREGHSRIEAGGEITLHDITLVPEKHFYKIEKTNGTFIFNKNDISVSDFTTKIGESDFKLNGFFKNLYGALLLENGIMYTDLTVKSELLDFEELLSFQKEAEGNANTVSLRKEKFPFLQKYNIKLDLELGKIRYKKVNFKNFKGAIRFEQPSLTADNISFQLAGGRVSLNSIVNFESEQAIRTTLKSELKTINIDSLLYMFDDFGQEFITYKNLKGEFSGTLETALNWNSKGEIDTKSIIANIEGSIHKGELNEFEPLQKLSKFIDADELAHIKFSELKNKIYIDNRRIVIPEMQFLSNVSDILISGTHTFDNEMDYKFAVPLKNLKKSKVDKDASFGAIEEDTKKGATLFLTYRTLDKNEFKYDKKRTADKIKDSFKKEKMEFKDLFKKKEEEVQQTIKPTKEEFFDW